MVECLYSGWGNKQLSDTVRNNLCSSFLSHWQWKRLCFFTVDKSLDVGQASIINEKLIVWCRRSGLVLQILMLKGRGNYWGDKSKAHGSVEGHIPEIVKVFTRWLFKHRTQRQYCLNFHMYSSYVSFLLTLLY